MESSVALLREEDARATMFYTLFALYSQNHMAGLRKGLDARSHVAFACHSLGFATADLRGV